MTPEPIDHAESARNLLEFIGKNALTDSQALVSIGAAQVHAVMASVAAQDRANELKRIEILVALSYGASFGDDDATPTLAEGEAWQALHDKSRQYDPLAPSIARSLGLGGESDGE